MTGIEGMVRAEVRERVIDLVGEGAWQYAWYNANVPLMIRESATIEELAEKIQDLVAAHFSGKDPSASFESDT